MSIGPFMYGGGYEHLWDSYNGGYISIRPEWGGIPKLERARSKGMRVFVHLAGGSQSFKTNGTFDMAKWKNNIDDWAAADLAPFIADGTIVAHFMIDEPTWYRTWGRTVTAAELDEMARYSKQYWPNLPTVVRDDPLVLARHAGGWNTPIPGWTWQHLDTAWSQYHSEKGGIEAYVSKQLNSAGAQGLKLVFGLNAIDGGDGSSGVSSASAPISRRDGWVMSADEIRRYGGAMMNASSACGFVVWRYYASSDFSYWDRPEIRAAFADLRGLAAQHPRISCASR